MSYPIACIACPELTFCDDWPLPFCKTPEIEQAVVEVLVVVSANTVI